MQTRNPIFDDFSRMATGAAGMAQAAGDEMKALWRSQMERFVAEMDLARRDEIEALKAVAQSSLKAAEAAVEKSEALERRIAQLEARLSGR